MTLTFLSRINVVNGLKEFWTHEKWQIFKKKGELITYIDKIL